MVRSIDQMYLACIDRTGRVLELTCPLLELLGFAEVPTEFGEEGLRKRLGEVAPDVAIQRILFSDGTVLIAVDTGKPLALVVDDNAFQRHVLEDICSELGFQVRVYSDAEQLLASGRHADLLIADMQLPGRSGLEAASVMRGAGRARQIVLLTASVDRLSGADLSAVDLVLAKPVDTDRLRELVNSARREEGAADHALPDSLQGIFSFSIPGMDLQDVGVSTRYALLLAEDLIERLDELTVLGEGEDRGAISSAAHSIRGLGGHLVDTSVSLVAARLEETAVTMSLDEIHSEIEELAAKLKPVRRWLSQCRKGDV